MKIYTDNQLKEALVRILPDILSMPFVQLRWKETGQIVEETQMLYLCRLAEEGFLKEQQWFYSNELLKLCTNCSLDVVGLWDQNGSEIHELCWNYTHATWQQKVQAMTIMLGIEI